MLTRWNNRGLGDIERTFAEFDALRREMNRLMDGGSMASLRGTPSGYPRVDLFDRGSDLLVRAEVPGLNEDDIDLTVHQGTLTLRGERKPDAPEGYAVHRQERGAIKFARSFRLPCRVDAEKTSATLNNGVLSVSLSKAHEDQPRQISIKTK